MFSFVWFYLSQAAARAGSSQVKVAGESQQIPHWDLVCAICLGSWNSTLWHSTIPVPRQQDPVFHSPACQVPFHVFSKFCDLYFAVNGYIGAQASREREDRLNDQVDDLRDSQRKMQNELRGAQLDAKEARDEVGSVRRQ